MSDTWTWRKSSRSTGNGQCVEIARPVASVVGVRDSKNPDAGHLRVSPTAFNALLTAIRDGRA
jgi:hypothetical protein